MGTAWPFLTSNQNLYHHTLLHETETERIGMCKLLRKQTAIHVWILHLTDAMIQCERGGVGRGCGEWGVVDEK